MLYQAAPGASDVTGRPSARDPSLMEGWAGWASADADGSVQILCVSRHLHSKFMRLQSDQQPSGESSDGAVALCACSAHVRARCLPDALTIALS